MKTSPLTSRLLWSLPAIAIATLSAASGCDTEVGGSTVAVTASSTASSASASSSAAAGGAAASSSSATTGSGGAGGGGASATNCPDTGPGEPNDTEATAAQLADTDDCDTKSVQGRLSGANDVDWYVAEQSADEIGCFVAPERTISQSQGGSLRLCKYVECIVDDSFPTVNCPDDTTEDTSPAGRPGCCGSTGFEIGIGTFGCPGTDDLVRAFYRIDEPGANADNCNEYNMNYSF